MSYPYWLTVAFSFSLCIAGRVVAAPPVQEPDAFLLYRAAAKAIVTDSPATSNLEYPDYPPFGPEWDAMAKTAWEQNGTTRKLAHEARSIATATIPPESERADLQQARTVANILGDAALYQHFQKDDAGAIETLNDLLHLATVLRRNGPPQDRARLLRAGGIEALVGENLCTIAAAVQLTSDSADHRSLQINVAHRLIDDLLQCVPPDQQMRQLGPTTQAALSVAPLSDIALDNKRLTESLARNDAIQIMAAISLASHIYQFENHRWPQSLADLVPAYLPPPPPDYWGDGRQSFGYVLIPHGLPDGSDRPLTYCRCESPDGLFYRTDIPHYGFYQGDGSGRRFKDQKEGGKFYDVAAWTPTHPINGPSTRPIPKMDR